MRDVEYTYVHACKDVPLTARYCPHCGDPEPFAELAYLLIERALADVRAEIKQAVI